MGNEKQAFSKVEVARQLSISPDSVNRAIRRGELKIIRFGRRVLIPRTELDRVLLSSKPAREERDER